MKLSRNRGKRIERVEVCGGIASGKTTLCSLLKQLGWAAIFENFHGNPFWALFNKDASRHAFETELTFLLQHYSDIKRSEQPRIVCDYSFLQDLAYAEINLAGHQLDAFMAVYSQVTSELPAPSLVIHLQCSAEEELARIRKRDRAEERAIQVSYLSSLNLAIERKVQGIGRSAPVVVIDSATNDFANDPTTRRRMLDVALVALSRLES